MNDLDTLRPEVRKAFAYLDRFENCPSGWEAIRAELLRLAKENADLRSVVGERNTIGQRRARACEVELAFAKNTINTQQGTMGALKRKLALSEGELAALKAAIAGSARVEVTLGCAIDGEIPPDLALCKVALVKVEK